MCFQHKIDMPSHGKKDQDYVKQNKIKLTMSWNPGIKLGWYGFRLIWHIKGG